MAGLPPVAWRSRNRNGVGQGLLVLPLGRILDGVRTLSTMGLTHSFQLRSAREDTLDYPMAADAVVDCEDGSG